MDPKDLIKRAVDANAVQVSESKKERFEVGVMKELCRAFQLPAYVQYELKKAETGDVFLQLGDYVREVWGQWSWFVEPRRIAKFNLTDLFTRPTKSPIIVAYSEVVDLKSDLGIEHLSPVMPFKVAGFTTCVAIPLDEGMQLQDSFSMITAPKFRGTHPLCVLRWADWLTYASGLVVTK